MEEARTPPSSLASLHPDRWTEPFWKAALERRLVCARCARCGTFRMPPAPFCHECQSQDVEWPELSGRGTVYSFTVVRRALIPHLAQSVPYVVAVVELDGAPGARLVANVVEVDPAEVSVGMAVAVRWDAAGDGVVIPRFRPQAGRR